VEVACCVFFTLNCTLYLCIDISTDRQAGRQPDADMITVHPSFRGVN